MVHWLRTRCGISDREARRWIAAAHALENLPRISQAFSSGDLGMGKIVGLTRFATPENEGDLVKWAREVPWATIRRRGDPASSQPNGDSVAISTT
jgi:hypothetical protein